MNEMEIAGLIATIHGLYGVNYDDAETATWAREMAGVEREDAEAALEGWKKTSPHFPPKIPELLERAQVELVKREFGARDYVDTDVRCDGTRWIEHPRPGDLAGTPTFEPCPSCNPLLRVHWEQRKYDSERFGRPVAAPPEGWQPPPACRQPERQLVTDFETARAAIKRGYIEQKSRDGFDLDTIEQHWRENVWAREIIDVHLPD